MSHNLVIAIKHYRCTRCNRRVVVGRGGGAWYGICECESQPLPQASTTMDMVPEQWELIDRAAYPSDSWGADDD